MRGKSPSSSFSSPFQQRKRQRTSNSGGPSSASSKVCGAPMRLRSQTFNLRSAPDDANTCRCVQAMAPRETTWDSAHGVPKLTDSLNGAHCTWNTSSTCDSNLCKLVDMLRMSHRPTCTITAQAHKLLAHSVPGAWAAPWVLCASPTHRTTRSPAKTPETG